MTVLWVVTIQAEKVYNESGGLVVMEMENTESLLGNWQLIKPGTERYPDGAKGTGHLEYSGGAPWGEPDSALS